MWRETNGNVSTFWIKPNQESKSQALLWWMNCNPRPIIFFNCRMVEWKLFGVKFGRDHQPTILMNESMDNGDEGQRWTHLGTRWLTGYYCDYCDFTTLVHSHLVDIGHWPNETHTIHWHKSRSNSREYMAHKHMNRGRENGQPK